MSPVGRWQVTPRRGQPNQCRRPGRAVGTGCAVPHTVPPVPPVRA